MATRTWDATDGVLASTNANWIGGVKPVAGDNVLFDVNSAAHACTFDLALALGTFTMTVDYSGTITQAASFSVTSYSQAAGTFTGVATTWLTVSGNVLKTGGSFTGNVTRLALSGTGTTVTSDTAFSLHSLSVTGTVIWNMTTIINIALSVGAGASISIDAAAYLQWKTYGTSTYSNLGTIGGLGTFTFLHWNVNPAVTLGTMNCNVIFDLYAGSGTSCTFSLGANTVIGGNCVIQSNDAAQTLTIDCTASNFSLRSAGMSITARGGLNARDAIIMNSLSFDASAGTFTQGTSTLIMLGTGNLKLSATGCYNLRIASGAATTLTAALNVYKDLRIMGTFTRGANAVSLLGAGEQTVGGYPDTAITVNSTGPVIFHECAHHAADVTFTAGTCVWTGYGKYATRGNLSIGAISRKPSSFDDVQNTSGTLTFDAESRMKDLVTDAGQTTVQSAGIQLGIAGKIGGAGTFTQNTPTKITRNHDQARCIPFPVQFCVNQPKGWGDA